MPLDENRERLCSVPKQGTGKQNLKEREKFFQGKSRGKLYLASSRDE